LAGFRSRGWCWAVREGQAPAQREQQGDGCDAKRHRDHARNGQARASRARSPDGRSCGPDRIVGTKKADRINARGGSDRVKGRAGGDRIKGAKGKDRLAGGRGGDRLKGSRGKDRIKGAKGKDRLSAGKGADRLKAVDDRKDRAVNGGPGNDVCTIDQADLPLLKNCEQAKVKDGGPGPGPAAAGWPSRRAPE
jgi:hypothetical protein